MVLHIRAAVMAVYRSACRTVRPTHFPCSRVEDKRNRDEPNPASILLYEPWADGLDVRKLCVGQIDVPLNDNDMQQERLAAPVVQRLSISTIFHSPLERARVTAFVAGHATALPIREDADLREVCLGIKQGHPKDDASDNFVSSWLAGETIIGAEASMHFAIVLWAR